MSSFSIKSSGAQGYGGMSVYRKQPAFRIDSVRITMSMDLAMASALGDFILDHRPENTAIAAMGHQLLNIYNDYEPRDHQE